MAQNELDTIISTHFSSVQCLTLCYPTDRSTPGFPVHHQLPESAQIYIHRVGDAIQPSHPLVLFFCLQSLSITLLACEMGAIVW